MRMFQQIMALTVASIGWLGVSSPAHADIIDEVCAGVCGVGYIVDELEDYDAFAECLDLCGVLDLENNEELASFMECVEELDGVPEGLSAFLDDVNKETDGELDDAIEMANLGVDMAVFTGCLARVPFDANTVSYTHLTLPTICSV